MDNSIKVSVIIPVYNVERYLRECLDTIVNQTLKDIEIICVDAGSTDDSVKILQQYSSRDDRIKVITDNGRLDAGAARNIGLDLAKGEYLSFLDSDDFFCLNMLESVYDKAKHDNADIVVYLAKQYNEKTSRTLIMPWSLRLDYCPKKLVFSPIEMKDYIFNAFQNWTWNKLFRKEFITIHNIRFQEIARTNDMLFTCHALAASQIISVLPKAFATYRVGNDKSLQSTNDETPLAFWNAYKETKEILKKNGLYRTYEKSFLNTVLSGVLYNLENLKDKKSYEQAIDIIKKESETEFGILKHTANYYNNPVKYKVFRDLINSESFDRKIDDRNIKINHVIEDKSPEKIFKEISKAKESNMISKVLYILKTKGVVFTVKKVVCKLFRKDTDG